MCIYIYYTAAKIYHTVIYSSIRDIFIFWKLSWGLENDNTLFKNDNICYIPKTWKNDNTLFKRHSSKIDDLEL